MIFGKNVGIVAVLSDVIIHLLNKVNSFPLDKMAVTSQTTLSDDFFVNETLCIFIEILQTFVPKGPIDNNTALD